MAVGTFSEGTSGETGMTSIQAHMTAAWKMAESERPTTKPERRETEVEAEEECVALTVGHMTEGKPLVLMQVNCSSICNKILEFWNLIDTYNPDVVIVTESWLSEETNNAEVFRDYYITFRRDRSTRGGGVLVCVKNYIDCRELWTDDDFEMIPVEVKGRDPKFTSEIVRIYRAPNEDMRVIEKLARTTDYIGNYTKRSIIEGDLNLPYADFNGNASANSGTQALINSLVWGNGYSQVADSPTRGDALLDVYLVRPESSFTSSSIVQGISDHSGVILEVEWEESGCESQVERVVPVYNKTDDLGLQTFLRHKFAVWASNGSCVEEIWNNFKNIVYECTERFVPHKILRKKSDPEYYNKEIKRLKSKVRKAYNRRKLGVQYLEVLKQLSKRLLAAKKSATRGVLKSVLSKEGKCWSEFYKYVKRRKGNGENIPTIKDSNGRIIRFHRKGQFFKLLLFVSIQQRG